MRDLLIIGTARENSSRLSQKIILPFGNTTLLDIYISKLEKIAKVLPYKVAMAVNKNDIITWDKVSNSSLDVIARSDISISQSTRNRATELEFLKDYEQTSVAWLNGCYPFIRVETIANVLRVFEQNKDIVSLHCVKKNTNWFWDTDKNPINNKDPKCTGTQYCDPLYSSLHFMHIFNRLHMIKESSYWKLSGPNDPYLHPVNIDSIELLDIDTQIEFDFCETIYKAQG